MQPKYSFVILSIALVVSLDSLFIYQVQCTFSDDPSNAPQPSPILLTEFVLPPSSSSSSSSSPRLEDNNGAPSPYSAVNDPLYLLSPSSAPIAMEDADGAPLFELPANFNAFDLSHNNEKLPKAVEPAVKKICGATDNPELCISSVRPFLTQKTTSSNNKNNDEKTNNNNNSISSKTDTYSLLKMQIEAALEMTQHAIALATAGNKNKTADKNTDSFRDCKDMYNDASENLKRALTAIKSKDVGTISSMLSAVVSDFSTCSDGYQESGGDKSGLVGVGNNLTKLISNCLATASLINH